jgi:hypothetical protein
MRLVHMVITLVITSVYLATSIVSIVWILSGKPYSVPINVVHLIIMIAFLIDVIIRVLTNSWIGDSEDR